MTQDEYMTREEMHDSEDIGLTAGAVLNPDYRTETARERRERHAAEREEERRFQWAYNA
jgi:hypothetical protein